MNEGAGGELVGEQAPNQFFRLSRQLPVAITFDPELRLTHGLRLREALVALFPSIIHAQRGSRATVNWCLDARWREGNRVSALSLASRRGKGWKVGEVSEKYVGRLVSPRVQTFRCVTWRTRK
ncbi:hypothetical protein PIB30_070541 [Stylosanthes scabra]|uniref:Uncharacterized protein n=1 Tax=Stylosanthes scabra TaxID=79078 RepID=A0ABU6VNI0_9FABA|nr:hypothetical protein [Stylosanthes scabra]